MKKIVVTGGSGKAGRATVRELLEHGYEVLNIDIAPPREPISPYLAVDLMELGETIEALHDPTRWFTWPPTPIHAAEPKSACFRHNTTTTYNIFRAATLLKLKRVVWASSETTLGLPFEREQPRYAPIDEQHPLFPESSYALSKMISEEMARQFSRWSDIPFVGLRFSNIMEPGDYQRFPGFWDDPRKRKGNLWGYIDARDAAQSCRRGIEADTRGAEAFIIAAADTVMNRPSRDLLAAIYPDVALRDGVGEFDSLLDIDKARRLLGYVPAHSWRDHLEV